jgi:membrane-bound lytic murein transglycosylase MltF
MSEDYERLARTVGAWFTALGELFWLLAYWAALVGVIMLVAVQCAYAEPVAARQFRNEVIREARAVWGLNAPVAVMAGQVEQESGWRPYVCSPYACGLTQFTPATADWIGGLYDSVGKADVFNPSWAIRAMVRYDFLLHSQNKSAATERDRWSFTLSSYNGGAGMLNRERRLCVAPCNAQVWNNNVAPLRVRATWAHKENRSYVATIIDRRQYTYVSWGGTV